MNESNIVENLQKVLKNNEFKENIKSLAEIKLFDIGFNIFALMSDIYYRENFHSDILAEILNPNGKHKENFIFLNLFFEFIDNNINTFAIEENFKPSLRYLLETNDIEVYREEGKIDILIYSISKKWAIIIENKINDAVDRPRQIQNYINYCKNNNLCVKTIIYIPRNKEKLFPCSQTLKYKEEEIKNIKNIFLCIPGYNENHKDIFTWLEKCQLNTKTVDAQAVFQQYKNIVKKQGVISMNTNLIEQIFQLLKINNIKLSGLQKLFNELPSFICQKIKIKIEQNTNLKPWIYETKNAVVIDYKYITHPEKKFAIDIKISSSDDNYINYEALCIDIFIRGEKINSLIDIFNREKIFNPQIYIRERSEDIIMIIKIDNIEYTFNKIKTPYKSIEERFTGCIKISNIYDLDSIINKLLKLFDILRIPNLN